MMSSAYLYQGINLIVAVLMVPLLLRYLDVSGFVLWSIFTTFGGVVLQLESAIQNVSVREIAKEYHSGKISALKAAVQKANFAYTILSLSVLAPIFLLGIYYLSYIVEDKLGYNGKVEWLIFIIAYSLNFYFGKNNSILLGMVRVVSYNNINSLTRVLNFAGTYLLLKMGFSVLGICLSFIFSVIVGCALISRAAKNTLKEFNHTQDEFAVKVDPKFEKTSSSNLIKYMFYMLSSFILYKGGLFVVIIFFPVNVAGSYGLTLQAFTMLSLLAYVPLQVWLHKLVDAIASENESKVLHELSVSIVAVNSIFVVGAIIILFFGDMLLHLISSKVMLVDDVNLLLMCLAFIVEANIFLLVNFLVIKNNYKFAKIYVVISLVGVILAVILTYFTVGHSFTLLVVPLVLQAFFSLPIIFLMVCHELSITPIEFMRQVGRSMFYFLSTK